MSKTSKKSARATDAPSTPLWTAERQARAVPFADRFPHLVKAATEAAERRTRGPQIAPRKVPITIRLSAEVAESLRAQGTGWQPLVDDILRKWLQRNGNLKAAK